MDTYKILCIIDSLLIIVLCIFISVVGRRLSHVAFGFDNFWDKFLYWFSRIVIFIEFITLAFIDYKIVLVLNIIFIILDIIFIILASIFKILNRKNNQNDNK